MSPLAAIAPDGSFKLTGLSAGDLNFSLAMVTPGTPPKGFFISRIEHNGVVVPYVAVKDGDNLMGVRVFVSYGTASIRGVVNYDRGLMPDGARMFASLMQVSPILKTVATALVDARGHFVMEGLPTGVYELMVNVTASPGVRPRPARQQVTLQDGVVSDVSLTLEKPQP